jgi:hypothetical protein
MIIMSAGSLPQCSHTGLLRKNDSFLLAIAIVCFGTKATKLCIESTRSLLKRFLSSKHVLPLLPFVVTSTSLFLKNFRVIVHATACMHLMTSSQ